ncbi:DUF3592 domain-containing protein [Paenarthrobacter nitroguajacolicus]|uniref:DUF3592 domain-containing protein n=1 Tax=Paenarthrobacter nitroguajacolicus TaxID=211146 RepID=UPI003AEE6C04
MDTQKLPGEPATGLTAPLIWGTLVKIVLYVVWALFVIAVIWTLFRAIRDMKRRETLVARWSKVLATVTGNRSGWTNGAGNSSRNRRFRPYYQYSDARGDVYGGESDVSTVAETELGSPLAVAYNPSDPAESYQLVRQSKKLVGCLIPAFAVFAASSLWFIGIYPVG